MNELTPKAPLGAEEEAALCELWPHLTHFQSEVWWVQNPENRDSYIAFGTKGDTSATYDLMENYNLADYEFIALLHNVWPHIKATLDQTRVELAAQTERAEEMRKTGRAALDVVFKRDEEIEQLQARIRDLEAGRPRLVDAIQKAVDLMSKPNPVKLHRFSEDVLAAKGLLMLTLAQVEVEAGAKEENNQDGN